MKFAGFLGRTFLVYLASGLGAGAGVGVFAVATYKVISALEKPATDLDTDVTGTEDDE